MKCVPIPQKLRNDVGRDDTKITFSSEESAAVRPRSVLIPFLLTEMMRSLRRVRR